MIESKFDFNDMLNSMMAQKDAYQQAYNKKLKTLMETKPGETISIFLVKLNLYKKFLNEVDFKMKKNSVISEAKDNESHSGENDYLKGKQDAYIEMRRYIDERLCKLNNMLDCVEKNNPDLSHVIMKERQV